ncbi:hypothetical protein [Megasphaera sueciensis]|uniref:hypothetical protein n=1 Tax=Megasphaera sueciensis TaxID=349094 RepID=UPI003CFEAC28|nr:hypothetical protein [Megasphaera sp.]
MAILSIELVSKIPRTVDQMPKDEVEQHLIITHKGEVSFDSYTADNKKEPCRHFIVHMDQHAITMALVYLDLYFEDKSMIYHKQGEGEWQLTIRDDECLKKFTGSLGEDVLFNGRSISYGLRKFIPITDLWLFDGKNDGIL